MTGEDPGQGGGGNRLREAALALPALGILAFVVPVAWAGTGGAGVAIYVFVAWAALIVLAARLARLLTRDGRR
jgi:hypothetical protein